MRNALEPFQLPPNLIPDCIRQHQAESCDGIWYAFTRPGDQLQLPTRLLVPPTSSSSQGRYNVPGIARPMYLGSSEITCAHETWKPLAVPDGYYPVVHKVQVALKRVFKIDADTIATLGLDAECFRLANPPNPASRNYTPHQFLAYMVFSSGFNSIMWPSSRSTGYCLAVCRVSEEDVMELT